MRRILAGIACLQIHVAQAEIDSDAGLWFMTLNTGKLTEQNPRLLWWLDLHVRNSGKYDGFEQCIVRPAIAIKSTNSTRHGSVTAGLRTRNSTTPTTTSIGIGYLNQLTNSRSAVDRMTHNLSIHLLTKF